MEETEFEFADQVVKSDIIRYYNRCLMGYESYRVIRADSNEGRTRIMALKTGEEVPEVFEYESSAPVRIAKRED